jgi:Bacterial regulatory helix-turn-helix protein, lysR family
LEIWKALMELRHLRYFIVVAEEGSLTLAAEKRLHTAQPSLGCQIGDLEYQVGVPLMNRSVHGIELTAAGRAPSSTMHGWRLLKPEVAEAKHHGSFGRL